MTTSNINTIEDLFRVLDENPEWMEALRARILTKELLELPEKHANLTETVNALATSVDALTERMNALTERMDVLTERMDALTERMDVLTERMDALTERMDALTERMDALTERMDVLTERMDALTERMDALTERMDALTERMDVLTERVDSLTVEVHAFIEATNRRLDNIDSRLDRMEGDNASLKGFGAEYRAGIEIVNIVEHVGKTWTRTLGRDEIVAFERVASIQGIPRAHLLSYRAADIIAEATDEDGATCYVVVEVSYTANGRDTTRATRSAGLLSRFTSINAYPVIAGFRTDNATQELIDDGQIHFYELEEIR